MVGKILKEYFIMNRKGLSVFTGILNVSCDLCRSSCSGTSQSLQESCSRFSKMMMSSCANLKGGRQVVKEPMVKMAT